MSGVRCRVPGRRRPATRAGAMNAFSQSRSTSGMGHGRWNCNLKFFGIIEYAKTGGYGNGDVPNYIYRQLVPHASELNTR